MLKRLLPMVLLLSLGLTLCGCSTDTSDANYTKISGSDGFSFYVDRNAVQVDKAQTADAKKITDEVESYVLTIFNRPYNGYIGVVDGDGISDSEPDLEAELDARIQYIALTYRNQNFSKAAPYLHYDTFDLKDDTAKVIISFEMKNPDTNDVLAQNHEGYIFVKNGRDWELINNIVDTGRGGDNILQELAANDDPAAWRTTYAYSQLKRSDYEDDHDFYYYWKDDLDADIHKIRD